MTAQIPSPRGAEKGSESAGNNCAERDGDILKQFIRVMLDVIPVLDQMKNTIEESSASIPKASVQLNNVSQATEMATVEILNVLDSMTGRFEGLERLLGEVCEQKAQMKVLGTKLSERLQEIVVHGSTMEGIVDVQKLWNEYFEMASGADILTTARQSLKEVQSETMSIAMALQVQDITSQQIASVVYLIESVRAHLAAVLSNLERDHRPREIEPVTLMPANGTFDVHAEFTRSPERQNMADNIINQWIDETGKTSE